MSQRTEQNGQKQNTLIDRRIDELDILSSIGELLTRSLDAPTITRIIGDKVREAFDPGIITIILLDAQTNRMVVAYKHDRKRGGYLDSFEEFPLGRGLTSKVVQSRQTLLFGTLEEQKASDAYTSPKRHNSSLDLLAESWLAVPILVENRVLGVVSVEDYQKHLYNESDQKFLQTISAYLGVALEKVRLFEAERQHLGELEIISNIQGILATELEAQVIFDTIGDKIREIFPWADVSIRLYEPQTHTIHFPYHYEDGQRFKLQSIGLKDDLLVTYFLRHIRPLGFHEHIAQEYRSDSKTLQETQDEKFANYISLVVGEELRGLISLVDRQHEHTLNASDMRLLTTLANSMSIALENAYLFNATQRHIREMEALAEIGQDIMATLDLSFVLERIVEHALRLLEVDDFVVLLPDETDAELMRDSRALGLVTGRVAISHVKLGEGFLGKVWQQNKVALLNTLNNVHRASITTMTNVVGKKYMIAAPMAVNKEVAGMLVVWRTGDPFDQNDTHFLQELAQRAAIAIHNAHLYTKENFVRQKMERELEIGRQIQSGFLPHELPQPADWDIAVRFAAAREVAGDFYDVFDLPYTNRIGIMIGDVSGKGVGAALYMTLFRSLLRATMTPDYNITYRPHDIALSDEDRLRNSVELTNNYIVQMHGSTGMFATLLFGLLDPETGSLLYINAGQEPGIVANVDRIHKRLKATGPAVGIIEGFTYEVAEITLNHGDLLLLFSDGVTDAENLTGEFFSRERLLEILMPLKESAASVLDHIWIQLQAHMANMNQFDDITMLAINRQLGNESKSGVKYRS